MGIGALGVLILVLFEIITSYSSTFTWLVYLNRLPNFKYFNKILDVNRLEKTFKLILVSMPNSPIMFFSIVSSLFAFILPKTLISETTQSLHVVKIKFRKVSVLYLEMPVNLYQNQATVKILKNHSYNCANICIKLFHSHINHSHFNFIFLGVFLIALIHLNILQYIRYLCSWRFSCVKGAVMQIGKALTNYHLRVSKVPKNFAFQLFIILQ